MIKAECIIQGSRQAAGPVYDSSRAFPVVVFIRIFRLSRVKCVSLQKKWAPFSFFFFLKIYK